MRSPHSCSWLALTATLAVAGAAQAAPRLDLSRLVSPYDEGQVLKAAGIARTSLDRSFNPRASASLGFLCGGQPSTNTSGAAGALGVDRDGRFLGAQLRFGFR